MGPAPATLPSLSVPTEQVVPLLLAVAFIAWAIYTLIAFYHWFRYGDSITISLGAMVIHLVISLSLFLFVASSLL